MRKDLFLPGLSVAGGIAGFGVRRLQLASAYNPDTQLFSPGAAATWVLLALIAGLAAVFLLALSRGKKRPDSFLAAFGCQNTLFMTVMAAAAFLTLSMRSASSFCSVAGSSAMSSGTDSVKLTPVAAK